MNSLRRHVQLIPKYDILKSIWVGEDGSCSVRDDSGAGGPDYVYAALVESGYSGMAFGNFDEKDWAAMQFLRDLVYSTDRATNKSDQNCLGVVKIGASCKCIISSDISKHAASNDSKDAFSPGYISEENRAIWRDGRGDF